MKIALGADVHEAARSALLAHVAAAVSQDKRPLAGNEADYLWDNVVASTYLHLAHTAAPDPLSELVTTLAKHDLELLRPLLHEWLSDNPPGDRQKLAARMLIDHDLEHSWSAVKSDTPRSAPI